ncbi:MAG TPA: hypothetical protein VFZ73_05860 [Gemmatimonadaceae bacterium]
MTAIKQYHWWWLAALTVAGLLAFLVTCYGNDQKPDPPTTVSDITVDFPGTPAATRPLLLYSGREGSACVAYESSIADPTVILDDVSYDVACEVEIDVFAPGLGAFARNVDPGTAGSEQWLLDAIASGTMSIALPPLTRVPVRLWLVGLNSEIPTVRLVRKKQLDKALPILDVLAAGLTMDTSSVELNALGVVPNCANASTIAANLAIYEPSRINVYIVHGYDNDPTSSYGFNCFEQGHPEILFISWGNAFLHPTTLVHELGHAMGLQLPSADYGHTYGEADFSDWNLMAGGPEVKDISIGQLYAMNFSTLSWLNRSGSPFGRPVKRTCQDTWEGGECPALTMVKPGWPP